MPDWAQIHGQFKPAQKALYRRAAMTVGGVSLAALLGGFLIYWLVADALIPASILWGAAGLGLLSAGRKVTLSFSRNPLVLSGVVAKKQTVVRSDIHRAKQTRPVLAMSVSEAFEITGSGRGADAPKFTGTQIITATPYVHSRVAAGDPAILLCLPTGEAMGIMRGEALDLP